MEVVAGVGPTYGKRDVLVKAEIEGSKNKDLHMEQRRLWKHIPQPKNADRHTRIDSNNRQGGML